MAEENSIDSQSLDPLPLIRQFDGHDWYFTCLTRRYLPHWELKGSTYFITSRVHANAGKPFLRKESAELMIACLRSNNEKKYLLHAFVVMPDHFHIIIKPLLDYSLSSIMQGIKGTSSYQINKLLGRKGEFWQPESFDHLIRNITGLREKWEYIKENPVRAKIVNKAEEYPFSSFFTGNCVDAKFTD